MALSIDDIDIGIITFLSDNEGSTSTEIVKGIFTPTDDYELVKRDNRLRYRLKRLESAEVVKGEKAKGVMRFSVNEERVFFGYGDLVIGNGDEHLEFELGYFMVIKEKDGYIIKSLEDYEERIGKRR